MLDFMRRHAASWAIKLLLGFISLSFALFFGYSAYRGRSLGSQTAVVVGNQAISLTQFNRVYESSLQNIRKGMEGDVPDDLARFLRSNVLEQMVQRAVYRLLAESLDFDVDGVEIARIIKRQKHLFKDGIFDMNFYREQFRPYYRRQYGQDYEAAIREDLLLDSFRSFLDGAILTPLEEEEWRRQVVEREKTEENSKNKANQSKMFGNDRLERVNLWLNDFRKNLNIKKNPSL